MSTTDPLEDDTARAFARALFTDPDEPPEPTAEPEEPDLARGNTVPREGNTPKPVDDPMREFAKNLFGRGR